MEQNNLTKIQQYIQQNPIIIGIFCFSQIVLVIILIFIVNSVNKNSFEISNTEISNLTQEIGQLPADSIEAIQIGLFDAVELNQGTLQSIEKSDATIRENSLIEKYYEKQNIHYVNFIVDIPSIEQSYQIFHEWTDNKRNPYLLVNRSTIAMCVLEEHVIYENFDCKDSVNKNGQRVIASEFLKYEIFDQFSVFTKTEDNHRIIYINLVNINDDDSAKQSYIQKIKETIRSLGISPDIFDYHILMQDELNYTIPSEYR